MDSRALLTLCTVCSAGALAFAIGARARRSELDALLLELGTCDRGAACFARERDELLEFAAALARFVLGATRSVEREFTFLRTNSPEPRPSFV